MSERKQKNKKVIIVSVVACLLICTLCSCSCLVAFLVYKEQIKVTREEYIELTQQSFYDLENSPKQFLEELETVLDLKNKLSFDEKLEKLDANLQIFETYYSELENVRQQIPDENLSAEASKITGQLESYYDSCYELSSGFEEFSLYYQNSLKIEQEFWQVSDSYKGEYSDRHSAGDTVEFIKTLEDEYSDIEKIQEKFGELELGDDYEKYNDLNIELLQIYLDHLEEWILVAGMEKKAFEKDSVELMNESIKKGNDENRKYVRKLNTIMVRRRMEKEEVLIVYEVKVDELTDKRELILKEYK